MKKLLLVQFLWVTNFYGSAQTIEPTERLHKNTIIANVGYLPLFTPTVSFQYERVIVSKRENVLGVSLGLGFVKDWVYTFPRIYGLIGKNSSSLELGLGVYIEVAYGYGIYPSPLIGYRHMSDSKRRYFRVGIGYPEAIYVGIGFRF